VAPGRSWRGGERRRWPTAEEQRAEQSMCQRRKKGKEGPKDLVGICRNLRDFTINRIFPLIQNSNEEITKIKIVGFFKSFNFALGFKFKNPKLNALFYPFALKSNFYKVFVLSKVNFM
jgi:hypothetical protein